jgi:hypothetical protein
MSTEQHPIIEQVKSQGRIRQEVGLVVQEELAIAGVTETSFAELKEHAEALMDLQVIDKASLADVQAFLTKAGRMKTTIKQAIEPGKKWAHQLHKSYTSNENEFIATVEAIEEPLKAKKQAYLDRIDREEAERQRLIAEMQEVRKAAIMGTGALFFPGPPAHKYVLGTTEVTVREVLEADHTTWSNLLRSFEVIAAELAEINAEKERQRDYEQAKMLADLEALRQQEADVARRQRELEEREAKMRETVNIARRNELLALGCQAWSERTEAGSEYGIIGVDEGNFGLQIYRLHAFSDTEWADELLAAKAAVEERNLAQKEAQEKAAREALVQVRKERLLKNGYVDSVDGKGVRIDTTDGEVGGSHYVWLDTLDMVTEDDMERYVSIAQAELARREAAHQEQLRQEAEAAARVRIQQEQAEAKTVTVERERLLRLLFSIQEVLPYAQSEGNDRWNAGLEQLSNDVMDLRRDLGDETLGPTF